MQQTATAAGTPGRGRVGRLLNGRRADEALAERPIAAVQPKGDLANVSLIFIAIFNLRREPDVSLVKQRVIIGLLGRAVNLSHQIYINPPTKVVDPILLVFHGNNPSSTSSLCAR